MKNTIRFFALLAAMMCFAACQPHENNIELSNVRNIVYTVDQNTTSVTLQNDAEWDALLEHLLDYAAEGSTVSFYNADRAAKGASKDVVEYSTTSREEMKAWMRRMEDAGMTVTVTYDSDSNTWHGMAYTTAPQPPLPSGDMLTYESNQHSINRYIIFTLDTVQHRVYCTFNYGVGASDRVYPQGMLEYSPAIEVNTIDAFWLIDYWCGKDVKGLIQMPFSRHWIMHIEAMCRIKNELCRRVRKGVDPVAYCGLSCNHCFLKEWCGGCRTSYNTCSYATCSSDHICPNTACCKEKGLDGCYECDNLADCQTGFYSLGNDVNAVKAMALFIRKYGKKELAASLDNLHEKYDFQKIQEILGFDLDEGLKILEKNRGGI